MSRFARVSDDIYKHLVLNAGIVVDSFDPTTGEFGNILFATSGGLTFSATPTYTDFGEDIDNVPKNMKELKRFESWEAKFSGTALEVHPEAVKRALGPADIDGIKITPRQELLPEDFQDVYIVADYSEYNGDKNGGFVCIHLMNALSTSGISLKTTDKAKGTFDFEYTGHYSIDKQTEVPFELFVVQGTSELVGIEVTTPPTKQEYNIGEKLDTTGIVVTATYAGGDTKDVTAGCTYSGFDSTTAGDKTVTATYQGATTTFTVTVKEA